MANDEKLKTDIVNLNATTKSLINELEKKSIAEL